MDIPGIDPPAALAFRLAEEYLTSLLPQTTLRHLNAHFLRAKEVLAPARGNKLGLWPHKVCLIGRGPGLSPPKIRPEVQDTVSGSWQSLTYLLNSVGQSFCSGFLHTIRV